jgi:predicted membrane protein
MSEFRNLERMVEMSMYSKRPWFADADTLYDTEVFDSIQVMDEMGTTFSVLTDVDGNDVLALANLTGKTLLRGEVITWDRAFASVTANKVIKLNRKFSI